MPYLLLFLFSYFFALNLSAQDDGSSQYLNAIGLELSYTYDDNFEFSDFAVSPTYLRRLNPNWIFVGSIDYARTARNFTEIVTPIDFFPGPTPPPPVAVERRSVSNSFGISIGMRYLFNPINRWQLFLQPEISYRKAKAEFSTIDNTSILIPVLNTTSYSRTIALGARPGLSFQAHPRWRILGLLGYLGYVSTDSKNSRSSDFQNISNRWTFDFSTTSLQLGVEFLF